MPTPRQTRQPGPTGFTVIAALSGRPYRPPLHAHATVSRCRGAFYMRAQNNLFPIPFYLFRHIKKPTCKNASRFFVLALPIFLCRQSIVPSQTGPECHTIICKNSACRWQAEFPCWRYLSSRAVTRKVLSAKVSLTSVFGMGTGGPSPQSTPTSSRQIPYPSLRRKRQSSVIPLSLLSKSQTLRWFVILSFGMYPEN